MNGMRNAMNCIFFISQFILLVRRIQGKGGEDDHQSYKTKKFKNFIIILIFSSIIDSSLFKLRILKIKVDRFANVENPF